MLSEVPRHVLVDCVLVPYLSGKDICALVFTSKTWWDALGQEEDLWKRLHAQQSQLLAYTKLPPRFPTCGNWRDVYLRSVRRRKLVIVRSLTRPGEDLRLVLPRITPLFGLKREIRSAQLRLDGLYLEDFDLFDRVDGIQVGIAGNDSLPPTEDIKRLLFLGMRSEVLGGGGPAVAAAQRRRDAGWRANLSILPDGIVLEQVLAKGQGKPELDFSACQDNPHQTSLLLDEASRRGGGPTSFKTAWRGFALHPLLHHASPTSLGLFCRHYLQSIARPRFALDVFVLKALLTSGFALSFYRLCSVLLPLVWTTQIKQMFRITHVLFLPVFARDLARVLAKAILPVMGASLRTELLRVLLRLVFTWETEYESVIVGFGELVRELLATRRKCWDVEGLLRHASTSPALAYSLSSATYWLFTKVTEPSLWVSLPLYLYSLPIVYCVIALRIRVFLAQSYVSLLLA